MKKSTLFTRVLQTLFGQMHYTSPAWLQTLKTKHQSLKSQYGVRYLSAWIISILLLMGIISGVLWYQSRPLPQAVTVVVTPPALPSLKKDAKPSSISLQFNQANTSLSASVAPLKNIGQTVTKGLGMKPVIAGKWVWQNDHVLLFTPDKAWPAGTQYQIKFTDAAFAKDTYLAKDTVDFTTKAFQADINDFRFQENLKDATQSALVASIHFNYPIVESTLKQAVHLSYQKKKPAESQENIDYRLSYDAKKRTAYIHSDTLPIPQHDRFARLSVDKTVMPLQGNGLSKSIEKSTVIPAITRLLNIKNVSSQIIRDPKNNTPMQVLRIETNIAVDDAVLEKALQVKQIPLKSDDKSNARLWQQSKDRIRNVLEAAPKVELQTLKQTSNAPGLVHMYAYQAPENQYLAVTIPKGLKSKGGYLLGNAARYVIPVSSYPLEMQLMRKGSLLSLSDKKRLTVMTRGYPGVQFTVARILPGDLNQFITQTQGTFESPSFINHYQFNADNISQRYVKKFLLNTENLSELQYTTLDLKPYLKDSSKKLGLYLIKVQGFDARHDRTMGDTVTRAVLITNMGVVVKRNWDKTRDVFVQSIHSGEPVDNANVNVIGKNGMTIYQTKTDNNGHAKLPDLSNYQAAQSPVAIIIQHDDDVSFIPYAKNNRYLNYTRFDISGISYPLKKNALEAYLFNDRGLYRPGETVHLGLIVKNSRWKDGIDSTLNNIPVKLEITDPRGKTVFEKTLKLTTNGYLTANFKTAATAWPGMYSARLYLASNNSFLGNNQFEVKEFQADTLRIKANIPAVKNLAWVKPTNLIANVTLENLFGKPAVGNKVQATLHLIPAQFSFSSYPGYDFYDPYLDPKQPIKTTTKVLAAAKTNKAGKAEFLLPIQQYTNAAYHLNLDTVGFAKASGQSVATQTQVLVSPLDYLVGVKQSGSLNFIKLNSKREITFIALNPTLQSIPLNDLNVKLYRIKSMPTLIKQADGTYDYQIADDKQLQTESNFAIAKTGSQLRLETKQAGRFVLELTDPKTDLLLSKVNYEVVGEGDYQVAKQAELSISLDKKQYSPGDTLQVSIKAPYNGAGLITIESDKVLAYKWFKTDSKSTVQTIKLPEDASGNAYVNVLWLRDINDKQRLINPLSYGVEPFSIEHDAQTINVTLDAPALVKSGETVDVQYRVDKPSQLILYAVNQGILQAADYQLADPLGYFFRKQRLLVETAQTLDLVLPRFQTPKSSASGGGKKMLRLAAEQQINPFKARKNKPVVFWSGIVEASTEPTTQAITIPDYFNGEMQLMAVAVSDKAMGSASKTFIARNDYIISPNLPPFVAPGDSVSVAVTINNGDNQAKKAVDLALSLDTEYFDIIGDKTLTFSLTPKEEKTVVYQLKAKEKLGDATLNFVARGANKQSTLRTSISIRPASVFSTTLISGISDKKQHDATLDIHLYPNLRQLKAIASTNPLILIDGLQQFLSSNSLNYTLIESSRLLALVASIDTSHIGQSELYDEVKEKLAAIQQRQSNAGGFSYWLCPCADDVFSSIYTIDVLSYVKQRGFDLDQDSFNLGLDYLRNITEAETTSMQFAKLQAYAIYLLTRNGVQTSNVITHLQTYLNAQPKPTWKKGLIGTYLAASYAMLQQTEMANTLIKQYEFDEKGWKNLSDNAQYIYLLSEYFPKLLDSINSDKLRLLIQPIQANFIDDVSAARSIMALQAYGKQLANQATVDFRITQTLKNGETQQLINKTDNTQQVDFSAEAKQLTFNASNGPHFFYQINMTGYDNKPAKKSEDALLEVYQTIKNDKAESIKSIKLGNDAIVDIALRGLNNYSSHTIAVVSLLPGGFEIVPESIKRSDYDYVNIQDDRVIFFTSAGHNVRHITYKIRAINPGEFTVPVVNAWDTDHSWIQANGDVENIRVTP